MAGKGNIDNLTPWRKGQSGNRNGRPQKKPLTDELVQELRRVVSRRDDEDITNAKAVIMRLVQKAVAGSFFHAKLLIEMIEGKIPQALTGPEGGPIEVEYVGGDKLGDVSDQELSRELERLQREITELQGARTQDDAGGAGGREAETPEGAE